MSHQIGSRTPRRDTYVGFCLYHEDQDQDQSRGQTTETRSLTIGPRVPVQDPFYTTVVPVNYISLRVFTGSTSSSTGRIRARFGGSFQSRNRRHRRRRHFLPSSTILIVESSSSMPSTPDAPDCGSRSREMYNVAMVFERVF